MNRVIKLLLAVLAVSFIGTVLAFGAHAIVSQRLAGLSNLLDQQAALADVFANQSQSAAAGRSEALAALANTSQSLADGMKQLQALSSGLQALPGPLGGGLGAKAEQLDVAWRALDEDRSRIVGASIVIGQVAALRAPMQALTNRDGPLVRLMDRSRRVSDDETRRDLPLASAIAGLQIALLALEYPASDAADKLLSQIGLVRDALKGGTSEGEADGDKAQGLKAEAASLQAPLSVLSGNSAALRQVLAAARDVQQRRPGFVQGLRAMGSELDARSGLLRKLQLGSYAGAAWTLLILFLLASLFSRSARRAAQAEADTRAAWVSLREEVDSIALNPAKRANPDVGQAGVAVSVNRLLDSWRRVLVPLRPALSQATQSSARVFQALKVVRTAQQTGHQELAATLEPLNSLAGEARELARLAQRCVAAAEREHSRPSLLYEKLGQVSKLLEARLNRQSETLQECAVQLERVLASMRPDETPTRELLSLVKSLQELKALEGSIPTGSSDDAPRRQPAHATIART